MTILPKELAGHWQTESGSEMAARYVEKSRAEISQGDLPDFALANAVFLANAYGLDGIAAQTVAKDRIRWLSSQLAVAVLLLKEAHGALGAEADETQGESRRWFLDLEQFMKRVAP